MAVVAVARKLAVIAWHLLRSGEDYAYANPAQVRLKWRRIELRPVRPHSKGAGPALRWRADGEREVALAAERAYRRLVADSAGRRGCTKGRGRRIGARICEGPRGARQRGRPTAPEVCALARGHPHPGTTFAQGGGVSRST